MISLVAGKMRGNSVMVNRLLQIALLVVVVFALFIGLHNARAAGATVSEHLRDQAKQYASRQNSQGVFSLNRFFNSTRFSHHKSDNTSLKQPSTVSTDSGSTSMWTDGQKKIAAGTRTQARRISPQELMSRPLPLDRTRAPKLLHQSWKTDSLPAKFQRWSSTCRRKNPDYEYVLWTDKDNTEIVKKYAPWFIQTYKELDSEIYRVDAMRNIYMHIFGGVYADLDTECIRPYDTMFEHYNISTASYMDLQQMAPLNVTAPRTTRKAFVGRMGTDDDSVHSIPNAWMASTPGHPFWLLTTERIRDHLHDGGTPEQITGPISLRDQVNEYFSKYHGDSSLSLDEHHAKSPWAEFYPPQNVETLVVLPFWAIYPYSWQRDGDAYKDHCLVGQSKFNASRCKQVIGVRAWGTWSVTYWSHSWSQYGGENVDNLMSEAQKTKLRLKEQKESRTKERERKKLEKQKLKAQAKAKAAQDLEAERQRLESLEEMSPPPDKDKDKEETDWKDDDVVDDAPEEFADEMPEEPEEEPEPPLEEDDPMTKEPETQEADFSQHEVENPSDPDTPDSITGGDKAIEESTNFESTEEDARGPTDVEAPQEERKDNEWRKEFDGAYPDAQQEPPSRRARRFRRV